MLQILVQRGLLEEPQLARLAPQVRPQILERLVILAQQVTLAILEIEVILEKLGHKVILVQLAPQGALGLLQTLVRQGQVV